MVEKVEEKSMEQLYSALKAATSHPNHTQVIDIAEKINA
jgi:hypothetical protein